MEYFYTQPSVITEEYELQQVGIANDSPQYTLDVSQGTLGFSNATGCNLAVRLVDFGAAAGDQLVVTDATAQNVTADHIVATQVAEGLVLNAASNLKWGGHSLYEVCPTDPSDWSDIIPFTGDTEGFIHTSWLRKPLTAKDVLTDLWDLAENGVTIAETLFDLYKWLNPQQQIPQAVLDALRDALDSDNATNSNIIRVAWKNLNDVPIAGNNDVGMRGDVFVADAQSLKVLP